MSSYIASNDNRIYTATETTLGAIPGITGVNRFPAVRLTAKQTPDKPQRRDKTGTRSFIGSPNGLRRNTEYAIRTYLTSWSEPTEQPGYGPLIHAALGAPPLIWAGGVVAAGSSASTLVFQGSHGLTAGQAVVTGGELRFVSAIVDGQTVQLNAPLSAIPAAGSNASPTVTYKAAKSMPTVSVFDYWSPDEAVQRILCGAAVDEFTTTINADYHQLEFRGPARDVVDSATFVPGQGEVEEFPAEPEAVAFEHAVIPGHLGQVWLGLAPDRFHTLTSAELKVGNNLETRSKEFGLDGMRVLVPGRREVTIDFELFASDDSQTTALYAAARQRSPVRAMFQLGQQEQQLFGIYLKSVVLEMPQFDDSENRVSWQFRNCQAQGSSDDEIVVAFG